MLQMIDMLVVLDALKDMKASLLNDFSRYKRCARAAAAAGLTGWRRVCSAFQSIRAELENADAIFGDINNLQMFLGNPKQPHNLIMAHLKEDLQKVPGYDEVLFLLLEPALNGYQSERCVRCRMLVARLLDDLSVSCQVRVLGGKAHVLPRHAVPHEPYRRRLGQRLQEQAQ